jgi:phage-related minor tail protein
MTDRTYVFRLVGDGAQLKSATESAGKSFDDLAVKTEAAAARSAVADRSAAAARAALASATTSLGATSFQSLDKATTSLGATAYAAAAIPPAVDVARTALIAHGKEAVAAGKAVHSFSFETAAAKRELLVLAHELSQGNYKKFGGSLMVLANQAGAASLLFSGVGAAVLGTAVAIGTFVFATIKGRLEQDEFNRSLVTTGNFAGQTASSFEALTRSVAASSGQGLGKAREALQGLIATGQVGPRVLGEMATAVELVSKATGVATDDVVKDFAKMAEAPAKWAEEHNKAWHFISAGQYAYVKQLEEQGKSEEAALVVSKAVTDHFTNTLAPNLGTIQKLWKALGETASGAWDAMKGLGKTATVDAQLARIDEDLRILAARKAMNIQAGTPDANPGDDRVAEERRRQREGLLRDKQLDGEVAWRKALSASTEQAGIAAEEYLSKLDRQIKGTTRLTAALDELHRQQAAKRAAGGIITPELQAAQEEYVRKENTPKADHSAEKLDSRFQDRLVALQQEGIKLDAETRSFELYGRSIDKARVAVLDLEIAQGKLKGLDPGRIAQLRALAAADDAKDRALDQVKINAEVDKNIAQLREQATLKQANARDTEVATRLAEMEAKGIKVGSEAYIENAASIRVWVSIKHDQALVRQLAAQQLENDAEVQKIDEETQALGLSTIERQKAVAVLRLQAQAQRDIAANPGQTAQLLDASIAKQNALTDALARGYTASREFDTGFRTALTRYQEDAGNQAAYADRVVGGGLDRATDALVEFEKTGKIKLGSLWRFMADEFLKQQARMIISQQTGAGGWLSALGSLFGAFSGGSGQATNTTGDSLPTSGGRANGGTVAAGSFHEVSERGPELLHQEGRDYLMMGGKGGFITPLTSRSGSGSGKGGGNVYVTNNSKAEVQEAKQDDDGNWHLVIQEAVRQSRNAIASDIHRGSGQVPSAMRARGLSLNGSNPRTR